MSTILNSHGSGWGGGGGHSIAEIEGGIVH